jgi:hypothetical protein
MLLDLTGPTEMVLSDLDAPGLHIHGEAGGEGVGALQMFAASLVLCAASVLDAYAHGPLGAGTSDLRLCARWSYGERPARVDHIALTVTWPWLPAERRDAVDTCAVHRTLAQPPAMETHVETSAPDASATV